jgi:hypothetical protein
MADVLTADALNHSAPTPAASAQARTAAPSITREVAHEAPAAPHTYETSPAGQQFLDRVETAKRSALEGVPEYRVKDMGNAWESAHAMGKERGHFQVANSGRDLDGDWKHGFAEHADEAAMNSHHEKAYAAAKEAGHGPEWKEAYDLGKAHVIQRAEFDGVLESAGAGVKMLAKDAAGMLTEGPVGEAMALEDAATVASRAPSIGKVVGATLGGAAAVTLAGALAEDLVHRAGESVGLPPEKIDPAIHAMGEKMAPVTNGLDSFHKGVWEVIDAGNSIGASVSGAVHEQVAAAVSHGTAILDPVISPILKPLEPARDAVVHAAEPVTNALSGMMHSLSEAFDHRMASNQEVMAKALQENLVFALEHRGTASLTADEAHQVIKELAHANNGDTLVIDNHAIHMVPAGTKMPEFPPGALKLDAEVLREGLGIERAQQAAQSHAQPTVQVAQATASHGMER